MSSITFIIGLPGSGKSTLIKYYQSHPFIKYKIYDDWMKCTLNNQPKGEFIADCQYESLISDIKNNTPILISGIDFCDYNFLLKSEYYLKSQFPEIQIDRVYFENSPDKCAINIEYRDIQNGGYWEENEKGEKWYYGTIYELKPLYLQEIENAKRISQKYYIPKNYNPLPIIVQDK